MQTCKAGLMLSCAQADEEQDAADYGLENGKEVMFRTSEVIFCRPPTIAELKAAAHADAGGPCLRSALKTGRQGFTTMCVFHALACR